MQELLLVVFGIVLPLTVIIGGMMLAAWAIHRKSRLRELAYRERIAMIEKGLVPPPETDPQRFERMMRTGDPVLAARMRTSAARRRSGGVMMIGVGLALMLIIYFAGNEAGAALGVGGGLMAVGFAMVVNAMLDQRQVQAYEVQAAPEQSTPNQSQPH
jgi:hypothetical protein